MRFGIVTPDTSRPKLLNVFRHLGRAGSIVDAIDWVEVEFDNLRAGFRWATDRDDLTDGDCDRSAHGDDRVRACNSTSRSDGPKNSSRAATAAELTRNFPASTLPPAPAAHGHRTT